MFDEAALLAKAKELRDETFIKGLRVDQYFHQGYTLDAMLDYHEIQENAMIRKMDRIFGTAEPQEMSTDTELPLKFTFYRLEKTKYLWKFVPSVLKFLDELKIFSKSEKRVTKYKFAILYTELIVQTESFKKNARFLEARDKGLWEKQWYREAVHSAHENCVDAFALTGYCKPSQFQGKSTRGQRLFFECIWEKVFGTKLDIAKDSKMPSLWIYLCFAIARERGYPWPWQSPKEELRLVIPGRSYISAILQVSKYYKSFEFMENIFEMMEYTLWEYIQHTMLSGMTGHPAEQFNGRRSKCATNQQLAEIYWFFKDTGRKITSAGGPKCFHMGLPNINATNPNYKLNRVFRGISQKVASEALAIISSARGGDQFNWANDFRGGIWVVADRYLETLENPTKINIFLRSGPLCSNDHFRDKFEKDTPIFPDTGEAYRDQLFKQYPDEEYKEVIGIIFQEWYISRSPYPRIH